MKSFCTLVFSHT